MPLGELPTAMAAIYGTFTFNETTETQAINITPVYDASGRAVVYSVYAITLRTLIAATTTTDAAVQSAVAQLTAPARDFRYLGRGCGDLVINLGRVRDVVWGPKPEVVGLEPCGAGKAVWLTWTVKVAIPTCSDATYAFNVMEFCYKLSYERDKSGYTTRVYSGFLRIPQTRKAESDRTLSDSADAYLEKIYPPLVPGFRRVPGTWVLDESKCRGDFQIRDEEMPPYAPPPGIVECSFEHSYQTTGNGIYLWHGTINASYEVARDADPAKAVDAFLVRAFERITLAGDMRIGGGLPPGAALGPGPGGGGLAGAAGAGPARGDKVPIRPIAASVTEPNAYGRTQARFSLTYLVGGVALSEILERGALWHPAGPKGESGWAEWAASMKTALSPRGYAAMRFALSDDGIIDLCRPAQPQQVSPGVPTDAELRTPNTGGALAALDARLRDMFPPPTKENSWIHYRQYVEISADTGRVVCETLPDAPLPVSAGSAEWDPFAGLPETTGQGVFPPLGGALAAGGALAGVGGFLPATSQSSAGQSAGGRTSVHQRTRPTLYLTLFGEAIRAGYPIPVPALTSVNGARPVLIGKPTFAQGVVANLDVPIYAARWSLEYVFTDDGGKPTQVIPAPPNPLHA
jgi:hypothetical protein